MKVNNQLIHRPKGFLAAGLIALVILIGTILYRQTMAVHQRQAEVAIVTWQLSTQVCQMEDKFVTPLSSLHLF